MTDGLLVVKNSIKYNCNNLEENEDDKKESINIKITEQKTDPEMTKMLLTLDDQVYKNKTRKILLWLTTLKITKQADKEIYSKK